MLNFILLIDEKNYSVELTEKGIELITSANDDTHFFVMPDVGSAIAENERSDDTEQNKLERKET